MLLDKKSEEERCHNMTKLVILKLKKIEVFPKIKDRREIFGGVTEKIKALNLFMY